MVNMKKSKIYSNTAFIIGNGKSRENFDLEQLRPHGHIYGCNALYRNFAPDYLIAIDAVSYTHLTLPTSDLV